MLYSASGCEVYAAMHVMSLLFCMHCVNIVRSTSPNVMNMVHLQDIIKSANKL